MGWFIKFIDSSLGKKLVMALTGLFLALFLIEHLIGNLLLLKNDGGEAFTAYGEFLTNPNNYIARVLEVCLFLIFIYHILNGLRLWWSNRQATDVRYKSNNPSANSTFFSRFMVWSGSITFIFLVIHLRTFFFPYRFGDPGNSLYQGVVEAFSSPVYSIFYIIAMILLAFHLVHGVQSAFQTLGIRHKKYTPLIKICGISFAIIICAAFALIPIHFLLTGGN
jgi:succinate dehydrogenase / fumarate reductase cytochrome b subunit